MKTWMNGKQSLLVALSSLIFVATCPASLFAEPVYSAPSPEEAAQLHEKAGMKRGAVLYVPRALTPTPVVSNAREDWQSVQRGVLSAADALRREIAATAMTMFFIRSGTPPSTQPNDPGSQSTPPAQTNGNSGGSNPPGPTGSGEVGPSDPGAPPASTPEPGSLLLALLAAAGCGCLRRKYTACGQASLSSVS